MVVVAPSIHASGHAYRWANGGTPFAELGLGDASLSGEALVDAMMAHPILINRPLVVSPAGVKLCRPSEAVLDLLPVQQGAFRKEDGERVMDKHGQRVA